MIFPKENTQITFKPNYLHGVLNLFSDDDEMYKHFKLTKEEINEIETNGNPIEKDEMDEKDEEPKKDEEDV